MPRLSRTLSAGSRLLVSLAWVSAAVWAAVWVTSSARAQVWTELGHTRSAVSGYQYVGRVSAVACSRSNPNLIYAAGADGGVWKSADAGGSWAPLTDFEATTAMGALAIDPSNESIIYAGTGEANFANHSRPGQGILKSMDAGATWTLLAQGTFAGRCISRIAINPATPSVLYAGVTRAGGFPAPAAAKGHPLANGPRGVFRSTDSGATWTQLSGGLPQLDCTDLVLDPADPTVLYAAIGFIFGDASNGIYKSIDSGATWIKLAGGLPAAPGRIALAIAPTNRNRLYTLIANPADAAGGSASTLGAYRSDDAGATWNNLNIGSIQSSYGWFLCTIGVSPVNPNLVYAAGLELYVSTNAGASWSGTNIPHVDCHDIQFDASSRPVVGCDGGLFRREGSAWANLNTGLRIMQYYAGLSTHPSNTDIFLAGSQDNGTLLRTDTSISWSHRVGGDGGWTQIDQADPSIMYAESQGTGSISRSTNGGASFSFIGGGISGRNCFLPPFLIDPADHNRLLYATERVWESLDSGTNWHTLSVDLTAGGSAAIRALAIAPSDSHYVYAATNDGRVLASSDSGATFTVIRQNNPGWPRVTRELFVDPGDPRTLYLAVAAYGASQVVRTRDGGATWEALDAGLPDVPVNVVAVDTRSALPRIFAGTDAGLYVSVDDGATWTRYARAPGSLPNACVIDLRLETARRRLVVATQGRGAWTVPIYCPADVDQNGFVNGDDYDFFAEAFDTAGKAADFNGDGFVNGDDYDLFAGAFDAGC
ncbi:MAG: hypothetical protein HUU19_10150 [Phycisphaerales bacterium]|nr:hypothetical protein [Phycisphaerales bacterium]